MADANINAVITAEDRASKTLKKFSGNVGTMAKKTAVALGAVGAALTVIAKNATDFTVDYVKDSKKLAREIGTTVTESSRLVAATKRLGIETEQASTSFGILSKNIVASLNASDKTVTVFEKLGIKIKNANGDTKSFNDILFETADKFKEMPDGIEKTALSMELFGRSGKDMIKFLNLGSEGIKELEEQADKLGLTLTPKTIGAIEKYIESQKKLKENTDSVKIAIGTLTTPTLTKFNEKIAEVLENINKSEGPWKSIIAHVGAFGGAIALGLAAVIGFVANVVQAWPVIAGVFKFIGGLFTGLSGLIVAAVAIWIFNLYKFIQNFSAIKEGFILGAKQLGRSFKFFLIDPIVNSIKGVINWFDRLRRTMHNAFAGIGNFIMNSFKGVFNWLFAQFNKLKNIINSIKSAPSSAARGIGSLLGKIPLPHFDSGGVVPGAVGSPQLVVAHGGETVLPTHKTGGGVQPNIVVNIGMYAGTEIEKRKIATSLFKAYQEAMR